MKRQIIEGFLSPVIFSYTQQIDWSILYKKDFFLQFLLMTKELRIVHAVASS